MQRTGLEWIYRIIQEPGRLWKRYGLGLLKFGWLGGWEILLAWLCFWLPNRREPSFRYDGAEHAVTVDFTGVRRLGNPERLVVLEALLEAAKNGGCPLRLRNAGPLLRLQLWAHRLRA
ncbi:hypothetical protein SDC9_207721 [bioreactor metagenome]|uniref:Uncharacterized protein n=1 Tax=bioreactor metagenome TaxID=1076179 RepID=A0A645J8J1_9ZZZZ